MTTLVASATQVSDALGELTRHVTESVVLVRGSRGSSGSGVVWDQPGLVITNHHVVPGPVAELTLHSGRRVRAQVVRRSASLDLAALKVEAEDASALEHPASIGDSDGLRVGDLVLAVGNPMGERDAPSLGIVATSPADMLRLAITLRPGNSGGALVSMRGDVVGIPNMVTGSGLAVAVSTRSVRRFLSGRAEQPADDDDGVRWV